MDQIKFCPTYVTIKKCDIIKLDSKCHFLLTSTQKNPTQNT